MYKPLSKPLLAIVLTLLFGLITACDRPLSRLIGGGSQVPIAITIDHIGEAGQPGQFTLSGTATLPAPAPLTVSAVQTSPALPNDPSQAAPTFAILDRTTAVVSNGRWQAQIDLSALGSPMNSPTNLPIMLTSSAIAFLATVEPADFARSGLARYQGALANARNSLLNFTPDGEPYLQTSKGQTITLPRDRAMSPGTAYQTEPSTWAGRLSLDPVNSSLQAPQPTPFAETDNLPLPESNVMR
jgi:hypothetical protein